MDSSKEWTFQNINGIGVVAVREFMDKTGHFVMVSFGMEGAFVFNDEEVKNYVRIEEFIQSSNEDKNKLYKSKQEIAYSSFSQEEDEIQTRFVAKDPLINEIFSRDIAREIIDHLKNIDKILKENNFLRKETESYINEYRKTSKAIESLSMDDIIQVTNILKTFLQRNNK